MQAASLVHATAAHRSKGDHASAKAPEGGPGAGAFADLLNQAEECGEGGEPGAAGSAASLQTALRGGKIGKPILGEPQLKGELPEDQAVSAKAWAEAALQGSAKAAAEEQAAEATTEGIVSTAESADGTETDREEDRLEVPAHPELVAWLAGLLPAPAAAKETTGSQALQQTEASETATNIQARWPSELKVATKADRTVQAADKLNAHTNGSTGPEQLQSAFTAQAPTEARSKPAGTPANKAAPSASTSPAPADPGPPSTSGLTKPASPEPAASQPQVSTPVSGTQGLRENLPTTSQTSATRSEAVIQPSVHSPAFAPAFSARIATLARDGLEMARVHLNPVDMGPVSVQLSLEGQQVRVDMTADVAATRRVLEQALPTLAGALREAGFTLSGGGVYQPAADARSGSQDNGSSAGASSQGSAATDYLGTASGGTGGQGSTGNPFRQDPQAPDSFAASRLVTLGEDMGMSAENISPSRTARQGAGLVDVFA